MDNTLYRKARFMTSAAHAKQFPGGDAVEVAFAGRSNSGKSSAINTLCDNRNLARTSKTPGRTQLINFFELDEQRRLVDLPGYGFAKVPEKMRAAWQGLMESYLQGRPQLHGLVIIMDIRHPLKDFDWQMLQWCHHYDLPAHLLLTKADKLKRTPAHNALMDVRRQLAESGSDASAQIFSALNKTGLQELIDTMDAWLQFDRQP